MQIWRPQFFVSIVSTAAVVATILAVVAVCSAEEHKAINVTRNRNLPFSDGILAGNTLYVAGQEGTDDQGKLVAGGITAEAKAAASNLPCFSMLSRARAFS